MGILKQESLSRACIRHVSPPLVTKAVEGNDTRPSTGVEQQELAKHYCKIPYVGHFSGVAQQRARKRINRFCKLIEIKFVYSCAVSGFGQVLKSDPREAQVFGLRPNFFNVNTRSFS